MAESRRRSQRIAEIEASQPPPPPPPPPRVPAPSTWSGTLRSRSGSKEDSEQPCSPEPPSTETQPQTPTSASKERSAPPPAPRTWHGSLRKDSQGKESEQEKDKEGTEAEDEEEEESRSEEDAENPENKPEKPKGVRPKHLRVIRRFTPRSRGKKKGKTQPAPAPDAGVQSIRSIIKSIIDDPSIRVTNPGLKSPPPRPKTSTTTSTVAAGTSSSSAQNGPAQNSTRDSLRCSSVLSVSTDSANGNNNSANRSVVCTPEPSATVQPDALLQSLFSAPAVQPQRTSYTTYSTQTAGYYAQQCASAAPDGVPLPTARDALDPHQCSMEMSVATALHSSAKSLTRIHDLTNGLRDPVALSKSINRTIRESASSAYETILMRQKQQPPPDRPPFTHNITEPLPMEVDPYTGTRVLVEEPHQCALVGFLSKSLKQMEKQLQCQWDVLIRYRDEAVQREARIRAAETELHQLKQHVDLLELGGAALTKRVNSGAQSSERSLPCVTYSRATPEQRLEQQKHVREYTRVFFGRHTKEDFMALIRDSMVKPEPEPMATD